jgi:hypothetical protein
VSLRVVVSAARISGNGSSGMKRAGSSQLDHTRQGVTLNLDGVVVPVDGSHGRRCQPSFACTADTDRDLQIALANEEL